MISMPPLHVYQPLAQPSVRARVHSAGSLTSGRTMCGAVEMTVKTEAGQRMQRFAATSKPVNCKACMKSVELVVRDETRKLSYAQLEEVLTLITKLRAG